MPEVKYKDRELEELRRRLAAMGDELRRARLDVVFWREAGVRLNAECARLQRLCRVAGLIPGLPGELVASRAEQRAQMARLLEEEDGNVTRLARRLGVKRTTLRERLVAMGLRGRGPGNPDGSRRRRRADTKKGASNEGRNV